MVFRDGAFGRLTALDEVRRVEPSGWISALIRREPRDLALSPCACELMA
jgi:hypothetical protein